MINTRLVEGETFFETLKTYVGFNEKSAAALRAIHPKVKPHFQPIVDDFYATIQAHPGASASITGGSAQIARLKESLVRWLDDLLLGPHDEAYFQKRARIGRVHVRISLPQAYMFTAMNRIRVQVLDVVHEALKGDIANLSRISKAIDQIMDIELAVMLETYKEDLETKNRAHERLSTIGQLAAGIGHELRNPLGVIESSLFLLRQLLKQNEVDDPKVEKHLEKIGVEVQRSNKTISDLLELARNRPPRRDRVDVKTVVALALQTAQLPLGVVVNDSVPAGLVIDADPDQLARVLSNLFINAAQAMNGGGRIDVEAWRENQTTSLRVKDSGPGVPQDVRHRIFEALFTTKAKGSGLGLALCGRIVEAHSGTIALEPGQAGASFVIAISDAQIGQMSS